ncbi:unnamed protein product [Anisakis simplex]|uniref:Myosin motor domain-containing protein n=1 Tax=Anisakis simplex TaxID=6269 RepID=A0A0M3K3Y1_ANISI|nr:unnamed protein product [Anisakis simplex]
MRTKTIDSMFSNAKRQFLIATVWYRTLTNPILEAFGNAKTLRNNNSSRFGKFIEIHFGSKKTVAGGFVSHYLLEKSRICQQQEGERNYHIFYQLIAGADATLVKKFSLKNVKSFNCLQVDDLHDAVVDDYADFHKLCKALLSIGLSEKESLQVFQIVAAILHLGNVQFDENTDDTKGGCKVDVHSEESLRLAASLLGVEANELRCGLVSRIMQPKKTTNHMGTIINVPLKPLEATAARDALSKAIYSKLFDWIVLRINKCIPFADSISYIGVLDIAGFEFFTVNSFEQFCINYCNEKLQHFFNDRILNREQELYEKEQLKIPRIEYFDNQDCIELYEQRSTGLLDMLDEEARLPRPSPQHFTAATPRQSKLRQHREMRDDEGFLIRHYAGSVCYQTAHFLDKNNDALHASLKALVEESSVPFVQRLFKDDKNTHLERLNGCKSSSSNKLISASVSNKFRSQLNVLLQKLESTVDHYYFHPYIQSLQLISTAYLKGTHFVRCIKPNSKMCSSLFEGSLILSQLECAGMTNVLKLMHQGYPSRTGFVDLYEKYKRYLPPHLARLHPRLFCKCLFRAIGLDENDFKFGLTKVFFKPGKFAEFDHMIRDDKEQIKALIAKVQSWVVRLSLYRRVQALLQREEQLLASMKKLTSKSQRKWSSAVKQIKTEGDQLLHDIRVDELYDEKKMEGSYKKLSQNLERTLASLRCEIKSFLNLSIFREQLAADEQERIRKLEENMRLKKEKEEREKREAEENLNRIRAEKRLLEERRKWEEERFLTQQTEREKECERHEQQRKNRVKEDEQTRLDEQLARQLALEDGQVVKENEQTRLDEQLARRLALEDGQAAQENENLFLKISSEINSDIKLIEAIRDEFHRRLQTYQQWIDANQSSNERHRPRAPSHIISKCRSLQQIQWIRNTFMVQLQIFNATSKCPLMGIRMALMNMHEYKETMNDLQLLQLVYYQAGLSSDRCQTGVWYAHFDGPWVARQIEIYPNKKPRLLISGRDDMEMFEKSLDQTQLTRTKGAEILADEFNALWNSHGGPTYLSGTASSKRTP